MPAFVPRLAGRGQTTSSAGSSSGVTQLGGVLSLELWVNPDPAFQGYPEAFLLDKKYVAHTDYQLIVGARGNTGDDVCRPISALAAALNPGIPNSSFLMWGRGITSPSSMTVKARAASSSMADCDVLTESVVQRIRAFQQRGGLIVGDDHTCPAIQPDILLQPYSRTGHADKDKAELLLLARQLRQRLDGRYQQFVSSSNCEVIPYVRSHGSARYLFLVNDHREFGDYVGHHGRVMENGLPSSTTIELPRSSGFVYDLVHHRPIKTNTIKTVTQESALRWDMDLGPCEGAVLMITPQAIDRLRLAAPRKPSVGTRSN